MSRTEKISHFAVVVIATSAVAVSVWQGRMSKQALDLTQEQLELTRQHNRLTVKPYFNFTSTTDSDKGLSQLILSNQGYGPAIIKAFELSVDGNPQPHWNAALAALGIERQMRQASNFDPEDVFAAGRSQSLITIKDYKPEDRITLRIVYQSIYEEEFEIKVTF